MSVRSHGVPRPLFYSEVFYMARSKRASDEVYNARRRAKRLLARLEREDTSAMSRNQLRARTDYIESVRAQITKSYQGTRERSAVASAKERALAASEQLDRMTSAPRRVKSPKERSDIFFARQLNLARMGAASTLGEHAKESVGVFYAATRKVWRGRDPKKRNEYIVRALGASSLAEAYQTVLSANEDALQEAITKTRAANSFIEGLTTENAAFYNEVGVDSEMTYNPVWVTMLNMFG